MVFKKTWSELKVNTRTWILTWKKSHFYSQYHLLQIIFQFHVNKENCEPDCKNPPSNVCLPCFHWKWFQSSSSKFPLTNYLKGRKAGGLTGIPNAAAPYGLPLNMMAMVMMLIRWLKMEVTSIILATGQAPCQYTLTAP